MNFRKFSIGLLLLSFILPGAVSAVLPIDINGGITDIIIPDHLSGFHSNNLSAIGAWNDDIWENSENLICREINGRTVCYHFRQVHGPGAPVSMVSRSDVPDNMLSLLTALRGGTFT